MTVLGYAALMEETNYVRSLLRHGANAEVAVNDLGQRRSTNAILLIRQVHSELAGGKSVPVREGNRSGNSSGPGN